MTGSGYSVSVVEELEGVLKLYSDGSVVRADEPSLDSPPQSEGILYKDIVFDNTLGLSARLYLPPHAAAITTRLPLILYFHGGGFCKNSPRSPFFHSFCLKWAACVGALIVSVDYRFAPEHRLPAAYHDSISALQWLHSQSMAITRGGGGGGDPWFDSYADFSKVFLMGDSAGGNIAPRLGMWTSGQDWGGDMRVRGLILLYPYFGGEARTASESEDRQDNRTFTLKAESEDRQDNPTFTLKASDEFWRLALPVGSNRDHYFCNPLAPISESQGSWSLARSLLPTLMAIGGRDILRDRELEYCEILKKSHGEQIIEVVVFEEEDHSFAVLKVEEQAQ